MKTILSTIMRNAWKFFRTTEEAFAECLKKAWKLQKLLDSMKKGTVYCLPPPNFAKSRKFQLTTKTPIA